ncbi:alkanesulfonate ABC transporter permease [Cupriavidus basilensis OR16]|uniref:Alkanesulfonate ABC transporter permease n=1 Tax=Cupriavidus basilensis OR16 TaxID=1127483 RepID=H1S538_9BURK|nr:ABC transporter permease subunit [Cupriavidus basilensis]EHP42389.1 alkanesulfonate ABC transporter permease [Cupriavidus basilensis OR16]
MADAATTQVTNPLNPRSLRLPRALRGWVLPIGLIILWWAAVRFGWSTSPLLVPVSKVWATAVEQVRSGALLAALSASLWRDVAGFALGASVGRQVLLRVVLPSASPSIFAGIHLALIYAWLATLGAEYMLVSGKGIGNTLTDGRENFWMDLVLFGVIVVGLVGFTLNWIASRIERRLLAWRGRSVAAF